MKTRCTQPRFYFNEAVEEGVAAGGGVALLRARQAVGALKGDNADQDAGIKLVMKAVESPLREIVANCGDEPSVVVNAVLAGKGNYGYNAAKGTYGDMFELGILDPTKVTRMALQNAASVASLLLTTEETCCNNKGISGCLCFFNVRPTHLLCAIHLRGLWNTSILCADRRVFAHQSKRRCAENSKIRITLYG